LLTSRPWRQHGTESCDGPLWRDHEPADLRPSLELCGIDRTVLVQAAESLAENLHTLGLAAGTPWIAA
jgi:L-fuconolactonase